MKSLVACLVLCCVSFSSFAGVATVEGAFVTEVAQRGDGSLFIVFDREIPDSLCTYKGYILVAAGHTSKNSILSLATAAMMAEKSVKVRVSGCVDGYNVYSEDNNGLFIVRK